jgi:uncharacterized protein (TIGR03437 family)
MMRAIANGLVWAALAAAQTPPFRPLHVSPGGVIVDDTGKPALLRGINRPGTGSGNADASATDADYAAQNRLLSMNLVRIFVNAAWWTNNVQVPIANLKYQDYIDQVIQRAKKYGNYVLVLKAGQFPDAPCGADGKNCPAPNQGDLNCQATSGVCAQQDTTGNTIDVAFAFWSAFAKRYGSDPAVLYDTWEDMHGIDSDTWNNDQNELIAAIRTYAPQSVIFVEDTGAAFEAVVTGTLPDFAFANLVWNFHLYNASVAGCTQPASPRYAKWSQNLDALVAFAQERGHAVAFTEWGGCNDAEPYHTDITSYAVTHSIALAYFEAANLITQSGGNYQLTATGAKVAQAFNAIASAASAPAPVITLVANAEGEAPQIAPNTWIEVKGTNLAPTGDSRLWQGSDFVGGQMPTEVDGVSVSVNGKPAFVYYISPAQVNILTPPDAVQGTVAVKLTNAGLTSAAATVSAQPLALSFFIFGAGPYVAAVHANGGYLGPSSFAAGFTPAKPNETIQVYANGFGPTNPPVVSGSPAQSGTLSPLPVITIGGLPAQVQFAGLVYPGEFQFNVTIPPNAPDGDLPIVATYGGSKTQAGTLITVQH